MALSMWSFCTSIVIGDLGESLKNETYIAYIALLLVDMPVLLVYFLQEGKICCSTRILT